MIDPYVHVDTPPARRTRRRTRRNTLILISVAALAAAGVVFALAQSGKIGNPFSDAHTVTGTVILSNGEFIDTGGACYGMGGFQDIRPGAKVVVTDAAQRTVATGEIETAKETVTECHLTFRVEDVPRGETSYGIEVTHRGRLQYTAADLEQHLMLSLG
ncbi:hypothetical protein CS0771_28090 [Catellatospora sp. IY07-71]|uniref:hypothetical protein n=1 Tax=Catellatospora sp. IY07-71 TaxID=2728827 RepID=UPI001BB3F0D6|nr:hypothetical protein [Catellatospora sp. IY07-71]BCJ73265.1 hypothetical protein CS0771_28090 [Catellatospora sp. IY07-71]